MEWDCDHLDNQCEISKVIFFKGNDRLHEEIFPLRIFTISEMEQLLRYVGFTKVDIYHNFEFEIGNSLSKNLVFVAQL